MIKKFWSGSLDIIKSKTAKTAYWVLASNFFNIVFGFISTVILVRVLGPADFGLLSFSISVMNIAAQFTDMGLNVGMVRFASEHLKSDIKKAELIIKMSFEIKLFIGFVILLAGFLLSDQIAACIFHKPELSSLLKLGFIASYGATLYGFVKAELQAYQWFKKYAVVNILWNILKLAAVLILFYLNKLNIFNSMVATIATAFFGFFIGSLFVPKSFLKSAGKRKESFWELIHFSKWVVLANFAVMFYNQLGILMLSAMKDPAEVGYFSTGMKLTQALPLVAGSLTTALMPKVSAFKTKKDAVGYIGKILHFVPYMILFIIVSIILSKYLVIGIYGDKYSNSIEVFQILIVYYSMGIIVNPLNLLLYYYRKPRFLALSFVIQLVIGAAGNYFLIPVYGAIGAAISITVVGIIISAVILLYVVKFVKKDT